MTAYTPVQVNRAGADMTAGLVTVGAAGFDTFGPGYETFLRVKNTSASSITVTVITAGDNAGPGGTFLAPLALGSVIGTTGDKMFGPFPASTFADPADGQVHVTYSASTSVQAVVYTTAPS